MFNYQFPVSPYAIDLKEARGEYDPNPKLQRQYQARISWRIRLAVKLHAWADKLAPALKSGPQMMPTAETGM